MIIDLHCHILPEVDDGAKHLTESIEMARAAVRQGISVITATPHHKNGKFDNEWNSVKEKTEKLNETLKQEGIPLTVVPGQEIRLYGELLEDFSAGNCGGLNQSNYFLIEFPSNHVPRYAERLIFDMMMAGLNPIIAHPERNSEIAQNPDLLYKLVKQGATAQLTAASITGTFGSKIKKFSFELLNANLVHFIASDAHDLKYRSFHMQEAFAEVEEQFGLDAVEYFKDNADCVIRNEAIYKEPPERIKKKKFFGIF